MHEAAVTKRLFVGGLASDVSSEEIYERFSRFGKVSNLSLKTRTDELGNKLKSFAHLDLEGDEANIKKCFSTYQNAKWKGTVLQLQYAKESFLQKLEKEIKEAQSQKGVVAEVKPSLDIQKSHAELLELKGQGVPGTPVPGKKDWVVGKYGRVLPVLKLKKSYKIQMVKYDPSKHCHAAKVFKDDKVNTPSEASCAKLTWEINTPDTEITKKRKGEFPDIPQSKKKKVNSLSISDFYKNNDQLFKKKDIEEVEIVKVGLQKSNLATKLIRSNRFDSDAESGPEDASSFEEFVAGGQAKKHTLNMPQPANNKLNIKSGSKPANTSGALTATKPAIKNRDVEFVSKPVSRTCEITVSKSTNKNSDVKTMLKHENKTSQMAGSKLIIKNSETKTASKILTANDNQSSLSAQNTSSVTKSEVTSLSTRRKIPEFKGLGMIGLLPQSSNAPETKSEHVEEANLNSSLCHKPVLATKDSSKKSQPHAAGNTSSPGSSNAVPELFGMSGHSGISDVRKKRSISSATSTNNTASNWKEKPSQLTQKSSDHFKVKQTDVEIMQQLPSMLLNYVSNSVLKESGTRNYDSSSSADTDEIIAQHKTRKGLPLFCKEIGELPPGSYNVKSGKNPQQINNSEFGKNVKLSFVDHNLGLSEFTSGISDYLEQPSSGKGLASQNDTSADSYDSDLDSNDFALVARKLAQKAMASKTASSKGLSVKVKEKNTLIQNQDRFLADPQKNKESKTLETGGRTTNDVVLSKSKPTVLAKSSLKDSNCVSKQAADNEKRLRAIRENMKLKQVQQSISRDTFKNIDSKDGTLGTRLVFSSSSSDDDSSDDETTTTKKDETTKKSEKAQLELFDSSSEGDDEEDYADIFKSKPHFEGQKGEKLMRLEQKIGDPRFKLDAKFAASDSEDEQPMEASILPEVNKSLEDEKTANLKVLENVIGKTTLDRFSEKLKRNTKHIVDMNTVRFDPTKIQKTEAMSGADKKAPQGKGTANTVSPIKKMSDQTAKLKEEQRRDKTDEKNKTKDQKVDKVKKKIGIDLDKEQNEETKKQGKVKLKAVTTPLSNSEDTVSKAGSAHSTNILKSSSLADLFKKKNENSLSNGESFSLLQQFDLEENSKDEDFPSQSQAPLSALFKRETAKTFDKKTAPAQSSSVPLEEKSSSSEIDSTSDDATDEEEKETEERRKQVEVAEPANKRVSLPVDEEDSGEESLDESDRLHLPAGDKAENEVQLINAGRVDVRYSKEKWLQRWEDLRPALVKMYKRKHKDALRNKRKNSEMKRKKEFLKNSKRHNWARKRVS